MRTNLPYECGRVIARALSSGVALDDGNVIDLLADNLPGEKLPALRKALSESQFAGRWPSAERGMKFPHNSDAWAYHLGALSTCSDQADFKAMRARMEYRENFARYFPHEVGLLPGLPARAVNIELETGLPFRLS